MQYRRTVAYVDLNAVKHNVQQHLNKIGPQKHLMAVVKANGYGHGAVPILNAAVSQGATWAGVSSAEEAIQLREAGFSIPILLMGGWYPEAIPTFSTYQIIPSLYCREYASELNKYALSHNTRLKVHLKVETGMGRLGFSITQLIDFLNSINEFPALVIEGLFSHLSSADEQDQDFTYKQLSVFDNAIQQIQKKIKLKWIHLANSAGISSTSVDFANLYRLGISMYGQPTHAPGTGNLELKEAITWKTSIAQLKQYSKNQPISYNRTFHTSKESTIATVCVGYADGYSRKLSNKGYVLVKGRRAPIVGRVCMDMFMIDVTDIENIQLHDDVVLIGKQGEEYISATEMASWIETINYEVLCNISARVPRRYIT